jgi:hypothetical protein
MAYLSEDDYSLSVSFQELTDVLETASDGYSISNTEVRVKAEGRAESKIRNFLSARYNLEIEFSKTGTDRNMSLVGVFVDLTLCSLYKAIAPDDIPEMRERTCKEAIQMLEDWRDGNQDLDGLLPPASDGSTKGKPEFVMRTKFISHPDSDPLIVDDSVEALEAPTDLAEGTVIATQADMTWTSNSELKENGFAVERSEDNANWTRLATLVKGTVAYSDTLVVSGTTYYYRVFAIGGAIYDDSDFSNTITVVVP